MLGVWAEHSLQRCPLLRAARQNVANSRHKWLVSRKVSSVEELETLEKTKVVELEAVTHVLRCIASSGDRWTTHAIILTDSASQIAARNEKWNGKPRLEHVSGRHPSKTPVGALPWTYQSEGKLRTGGAKQPQKEGCVSGRLEVLRSLRHYLRAQSQGHYTIDRLEERGVERGSARQSSFKRHERAIFNQTNIGTIPKAASDRLL